MSGKLKESLEYLHFCLGETAGAVAAVVKAARAAKDEISAEAVQTPEEIALRDEYRQIANEQLPTAAQALSNLAAAVKGLKV